MILPPRQLAAANRKRALRIPRCVPGVQAGLSANRKRPWTFSEFPHPRCFRCYLQRIRKIDGTKWLVYQWIIIFLSRFCPAREDRSRSVSVQIRVRIPRPYSGSPRRAIPRRLSYCGQTRDLARIYPNAGRFASFSKLVHSRGYR